MRFLLILFLTITLLPAKEYHPPASLKTSELKGYTLLSPARKKRIKASLDLIHQNDWLKYKFGSADPSNGGFDCSGAIYYLFKNLGYQVPRTSAQQYLWLKKIHKVSPTTTSLDHQDFKKLKPGDLVFWSGTYIPTDGRKVPVTHVGMYLGKEKKDGHPVMVCASKGRSYRGKRQDGYGVYDFKLPSSRSKSKLVGYGTPPKPQKE